MDALPGLSNAGLNRKRTRFYRKRWAVRMMTWRERVRVVASLDIVTRVHVFMWLCMGCRLIASRLVLVMISIWVYGGWEERIMWVVCGGFVWFSRSLELKSQDTAGEVMCVLCGYTPEFVYCHKFLTNPFVFFNLHLLIAMHNINTQINNFRIRICQLMMKGDKNVLNIAKNKWN